MPARLAGRRHAARHDRLPDAVTMLQGISTTDTVPMVRVPWNVPDIQKALDAGAYGIVCPMINTRAEAEKFVGSMRYAPLGYRRSGPIRAAMYGGADYPGRRTTSSSRSP